MFNGHAQHHEQPVNTAAPDLQVSVESPELLVPLISSTTNAWIWSVDQRMGLFSGRQHVGSSSQQQQQQEEQESGGYHDEQMLQVRHGIAGGSPELVQP